MIMVVTKQIDGTHYWMTRDWDRGLHANIAELAVDVDDAITDMITVESDEEAVKLMDKLDGVRQGLNKVMKVIALESTTPRFTKQSTKAIDLILAS